MKPKIIIVVSRFYNTQTHKITIGGVQTYMQGLFNIAITNGYDAEIIQICQHNRIENIKIGLLKLTLYPETRTCFKTPNQKTFENIYKDYNNKNTLFIISTDQMDIKCLHNNVVQIQHGVAFDIPGNMIKGFFGKTKTLQLINKIFRCLKNVKRLYHTYNTVCVDYNFYNWFRTIGTIYNNYNIKVIPNYSTSIISESRINEKLSHRKNHINIIFARRFVEHRGVLIFIQAADQILKEYQNINITFAGDGPLKSMIFNHFKEDSRVQITTFSPSDSVEFHYDYDIAVIPTIYSEGTSLSACEAMSAGCIPIATYVGGLSNIILNEYDGYLIYPNSQSLVETLRDIIEFSQEKRAQIAINAYNAAKIAFSYSRWEKEWLQYFRDLEMKQKA